MEKSKRNETIVLIIWIQAVVATMGSLFYSEVMGYLPCELCWYQRILMYPLVIVLGVYAFRKGRDTGQVWTSAILSGIGFCFSVYHYLIQKVPALHEAGQSCGAVPCNAQYVNYLGFITIPFMAGVAFLVIFVLSVYLIRKGGEEVA